MAKTRNLLLARGYQPGAIVYYEGHRWTVIKSEYHLSGCFKVSVERK